MPNCYHCVISEAVNTEKSPSAALKMLTHQTQISSVPSSHRTLCCDVWWIQHRLLVNPLTQTFEFSTMSPFALHPSASKRPTGLTSLMPSFFSPSHPTLSSSCLISFFPMFIWFIMCLEPLPPFLWPSLCPGKKNNIYITGARFRFVALCVQWIHCGNQIAELCSLIHDHYTHKQTHTEVYSYHT